MSDFNQQVLPASFIALFVPPGRHKPSESREHMTERHELCEDLAQLMTETAQQQLWALGVAEADVLLRIEQGLRGGPAGLMEGEAGWVMHRLAELLQWPDPWLPGGGAA